MPGSRHHGKMHSGSSRPIFEFVKLGAIVCFVAGSNPGALDRIGTISTRSGLLAYLAIWILSIGAVLAIGYRRSWFPRVAWSLVFTISAALALSFSLTTGKFLQFGDLENLRRNLAFADDAVATFRGGIIQASLVALLGLIGLSLPSRWSLPETSRWQRLVNTTLPMIPMVLLVLILLRRGGEGSNGLPGQVTVPAFGALMLVDAALREPVPQRMTVVPAPARQRTIDKVVVVMDESIRGDKLDLNNGPGVSGLAGRNGVINFGVMSSFATCSDESNVSFRYGASRDNYLSDIARNPSVWVYAARAGYETVYLDAQESNGKLQNLMDEAERQQIDRFVQLPATTPQDRRDPALASVLRGLLIDGERPMFVLVNKVGAHFPYEEKYPASAVRFRPALTPARTGPEAVPRVRGLPTDESLPIRLRFLNAYLNAVSWNVGRFFETLLEDMDLSSSVIFYLSDHGQDFHEDGSPGYAPHCSTRPADPGMGRVPMVVVTGHQGLLEEFRKDSALNFGKVSAFNVLPTVLETMGYESGALRRAGMEPGMNVPLAGGNQRFLSAFFVRFLQKPIWNGIEESARSDARRDPMSPAGTR